MPSRGIQRPVANCGREKRPQQFWPTLPEGRATSICRKFDLRDVKSALTCDGSTEKGAALPLEAAPPESAREVHLRQVEVKRPTVPSGALRQSALSFRDMATTIATACLRASYSRERTEA